MGIRHEPLHVTAQEIVMATTTESVTPPKVTETECFIGGRWTPSVTGKTFETINPATEEVICEVAEGDAGDVDLAVDAARTAFCDGPWGKMDARDRGMLIHRLANLIERDLVELGALESLDNGKPVNDSCSADLPLAIDCLRYYAGWADKIHGKTIPVRGDFLVYTRREPVGVVGQIIPWNFPILMTAWKWGPALATGCTIIMKPAEQTPLTCLRMAKLAQEAGIPDGVINVIPGYGPTAGGSIVKHPGVDKIAFTGEHITAQIIMREAAETMKRLTFELGGKSPNIVFADSDLDAAIAGAHFGLFFNQGQCCCAGSRVFVEESVHDQFVEKLVASVKNRKLGDPLDPVTEQGPQVDQTQMDKILSYIDLGNEQGAHCATGGKRFGDRGYFVEPTVFTEVQDEMKISTDEIFGPVMSVFKFKDMDEIIERANKTMYGLAAAVWTQDVNKAHHVANNVRAGTVWVNCYDAFDAAAPFGGFKMSGIGRELGEVALDNYLEDKTVTVALS
jgi:aldehyde dehydrogenase (NAD+)